MNPSIHAYNLEALKEQGIPEYAEKIYQTNALAGLSWKDGQGRYQGCCPSLAKMYDSSFETMNQKDELEQKDIVVESARALFKSEDEFVFNTDKKYIAFGSFEYADQARHVCYTKETFFDSQKNQKFVLVTGIEIPPYIMEFLSKTHASGIAQKGPSELQIKNALLFSTANLNAEKHGILLSDREEECLFLMLRGHTAKGIAQILNISFRTAEYHSNNLRKKLGCSRKSTLVKTAIDLGYLNLVPQRFLGSDLIIKPPF
jgi:DNA-binding CsgD family transcriptional regulator